MSSNDIRIVFIGDDWTTTSGANWPSIVASKLGISDWESKGKRDDTSQMIRDRFLTDALSSTSKKTIVVLECGLNDMPFVAGSDAEGKAGDCITSIQEMNNMCKEKNATLFLTTYTRFNIGDTTKEPEPTDPTSSETTETTTTTDVRPQFFESLHSKQLDFCHTAGVSYCNFFSEEDLNANYNPSVYADETHLNSNGQLLYANILYEKLQLIISDLVSSDSGDDDEEYITSYDYRNATASDSIIYRNLDSALKSIGITTSSNNTMISNSSSASSYKSSISNPSLASYARTTSTSKSSGSLSDTIKNATESTNSGILSSSTNQELEGENQIDDPELIVSHETCPRYEEDSDHHCKYMDIGNRCIFDHCIFDQEELPQLTRKWYATCLFCNTTFSRDPRYMKMMICDTCIKRIQAAETLPFTCVNCGKKQNHPAIIMFSSICDYCTQHRLFNNCCLRFKMSPAGIHGVDTNHEPIY